MSKARPYPAAVPLVLEPEAGGTEALIKGEGKAMDHKRSDVEAVEQNLRDAGCSDEFMVQFMRVWGAGTTEEQLRLLSCQRCRLLDRVHTEQRKLDCLDYLRYQLEKARRLRAK